MKHLPKLLCGLLLSIATSSQSAEIDFGRYHALVIGINQYEHLPKLETAVDDARAVHELLTREYGYRSTLLLDATRDQLIRQLDRLRAELDERDNLLIYYAGHGYLDKATDDGFWLPRDAEEESQVAWVPVSTITRLLKATLAKHAIVVADSCFSGTLTRDAPVLLQTGPARQAELERIAAKRARKALTSGGLEPVVDSGGKGHSVFTQAFLDALSGNDQVMDGYQLYRELRRTVVLNAQQTPQYSEIRFAGDEGGDYLFVPLQATRSQVANVPASSGDTPAAGGLETLLIGNTIEVSPPTGGTYRFYFRAGGLMEASNKDKPGNSVVKTWWTKSDNVLCRKLGPQDRVACQRVEIREQGDKLDFYRLDGRLAFTAELIPGRRPF